MVYKNQTQNNKVNGNRIILISNYLKHKWVECPKQKTKTGLMDTKTRPYICCLQETHLKTGDTYRESEGLEKDIPWK